MKKTILLGFALRVSISLICAADLTAQTAPGFTVLHQDLHALTFSKRQTKVITSQQEYAATLAAYSNEPPKQLDFAMGRVLLVDMGPRPSGGYSIEVRSVDLRRQSAVNVDVQLARPGPGCVTEAWITNPYQFVYIPTKREILVSERLLIFNCAESPEAGRNNGVPGNR